MDVPEKQVRARKKRNLQDTASQAEDDLKDISRARKRKSTFFSLLFCSHVWFCSKFVVVHMCLILPAKDPIFYDADEIVGSRIMASGRRFFLMKWAAKYGPEAKNSWEPEDNLTAMLIEEWEDKVSHRYVRVPGGNNSG